MKGIRGYLDEQGMTGDCDLVSLAGAAKNLASPMAPEHRVTLEKQIELASKLHGIKTLTLMNHTDCGAYGGAAAFASSDEEKVTHGEELRAAREIVKAIHPDVEVRLVLAVIDAKGEVTFESVS